ncbi:endolytic transglycosylase MltG [Dialister sp.]|uniref:endolytic transglycosylase MltG n=1 Tax=Dialister sp. TaxID=1955814 RepID=UPI002E7FB84B|nr:endolytic transglycosylase MltG [Dialister sp.]MEE3453558.1 endolytic transglycosylase MltG [Dialister sp.]
MDDKDKKESDQGPKDIFTEDHHWGAKRICRVGGVILVCLFCILGIYFYAIDRVDLHGDVTLQVPKNATGRDIADELEAKGVIRSSTIFRIYARILGNEKDLQSGMYRLKQGLTVMQALKEMHSGKMESVMVTVPEGYTVHQIAEILKKSGIAGAENFEETAAGYGPLKFQYGPVAVPIKAEGFLFADTYDIPKEYDAKQICDLMYKRTDTMLTPDIRKQAEEKKMTLHTLMTLASMVEREARFREDQIPIASVMLKRLEIGMPLQIDATIQYALGSQKEELTIADTKIDSPYNTYIHNGLPPGPIGAPGLDAIQSVLAAQPGEYLYYVAQADGHHVFTKSYEEHQAETENIYRQQ